MKTSYPYSVESVDDSRDPKHLVRVHIAVRKLGCSTRTIRRMIQKGQITASRVNRRAWGVPESAIALLVIGKEDSCFR